MTIRTDQNLRPTAQPSWVDNMVMGEGVLGRAFSVCAGAYAIGGLVTETMVAAVSPVAADRLHDSIFGKDFH
jgi:hypothetical protein